MSVDAPHKPRVDALGVVAAFAVAAATLFKIHSYDIWWQVRTGRWIWENRAIPRIDPFSFTADGPWASSDALAQLYFHAFDALGGAEALVWSKVLLVALLGLLVVRLADPARGGWCALVVALWGLSSSFRFVVRPHLFSYLGFAILLLLLRHAERRARPVALWWIPPLVAVWCNFHRGGVLALPILGLAVLVWGVQARHRRLAVHAAGALVASVLASVLNQGGLHTLTSPFTVSANDVFGRYLTEWQALSPSLIAQQFQAFGVALLAWSLAMLHRRKLDLEVAIVALGAALAFSKVRLIPYPALAMVPGLAYGASRLGAAVSRRAEHRVHPALANAGLCTAALAGIATVFFARIPLPAWGPGVADWRVPTQAAAFLKVHPPPGNMWHDFELGGYLLYALSPDVKQVFIDGRNDKVYRPEFFEETVLAKHDPRVLQRQLDAWDIGFTVTRREGPNDRRHQWLYQHPDWQLVFWDDSFVVMVRRTPESADYLARHGYRELRVGGAFDRLAALADDPRGPELCQDVLRNVRQAPDSARAHYMAALVHRAQGREAAYRDARETVRRLASARELQIQLP